MNKTDLAAVIAQAHGLTKTQALDILNTTLGAIVAATAAGHDVALHEFGTFKRVHKEERAARVPGSGEKITVPAKDVPTFKAASAFKTAVNGVPATV